MTLRMTLTVDYELNGTNPEDLKARLRFLAEHGAGEGMLTGSTDAEVKTWQCDVDATHVSAGENKV
jgi:hypothetical protein